MSEKREAELVAKLIDAVTDCADIPDGKLDTVRRAMAEALANAIAPKKVRASVYCTIQTGYVLSDGRALVCVDAELPGIPPVGSSINVGGITMQADYVTVVSPDGVSVVQRYVADLECTLADWDRRRGETFRQCGWQVSFS